MSKIIVTLGGSSDHISPAWAPVRLESLEHRTGDYDVILGASIASVSLVEGTFSDITWMRPGFQVLKTKGIADFNLYGPEPIPGGAMKRAWDHGKAAWADGSSIDSYPKDKGAAPHTVWVKGYLWAYLQDKV